MREKIDKRIPRYTSLIMPTFLALKELGGSGKNNEILDQIIKDLQISDEVVDIQHKGRTDKSELSYQADWARTYLSRYGVIENSARGVWSILPDFVAVDALDSKEAEVLQNMDPYGFERLSQKLLRECGFTQVEVTKKSGDGGIDGTGKLRINGIFSFNVAFQCKRYKGMVGAGEIRDFRGYLTTDIEKGVMITTGSFSKAAREEASNPGKQRIDLIDGEEFMSKIAEYGIGVKPVTTYEIDEEFFNKI